MKNNQGFYISKLHISGLNLKTAKIEFTTGFNVISGLSDTGKSYIFACINYMLGGGDIPKNIPESIGYTDIHLEIKTYNGKTYTLFRKVSGGNFKLKEISIEKYLTSGNETSLHYQHSNTNKDNISSFLLQLSGFGETFVKINKQNAKRELSFRDIAKLTLIDEQRIITENSPLYVGQFNDQPQNQSVFEILLTGKDAKDLEQIEEAKVYSSRIKGKIEFAESLIQELNEKILNNEYKNSVEREEQIQKKLDNLTLFLSESTFQIEKLSTEKQKLFNEKTKLESKIILQDELLNRFNLLKEHYNSDIKRLEFITEGEEYFKQLTSIDCPLCGGRMDKEHYDCILEENIKSSSIINSIEIELEKIRIKLIDLNSTIFEINEEKIARNSMLISLKRQLEIVELEIQDKLEPIKSSTKLEIEYLLNELTLIKEQDILKKQLTKYYSQKSILETELTKKPKVGEQSDGLNFRVITKFCNIIEDILKSWKYPNIANINFDESYKIYDIVINNKNRKAHGKGIRALTYTSFVLGIMEYCISENLPHSRNLIIDSPLTTYQGKENLSNERDITNDMEDAFFKNLSSIDNNCQIIILDNKDPAISLQNKINYIHFTGIKNNGRQGFFPI